MLDFGGNWEKLIPLVEFTYNISDHMTIEMALYETFYGSKCKSSLHWNEVGEQKLLGLEILQ